VDKIPGRIPLRALLLVSLVALGLVGCGGDKTVAVERVETTATSGTATAAQTSTVVETVAAPDESPDDFIVRLLRRFFDGQFGRTWDELHPGHQALVTRSRYEDCASRSSEGTPRIDRIEVKEVYDDPIDVERIPERTSKAVTVRIVSGAEEVTRTMHAVLVDDRWRWVLQAEDIDTYQAGGCPE
jgi:hypothetical protein